MTPNRISPQQAAQTLFERRHPSANCLLLAGSIVRGEATASSDLDIVVLYDEGDLPHAYRESLLWEGFPVETFVHSPQTLRYFFEKMDGPSGFPTLMQMVSEAIEIPVPTPLSTQMKQAANDCLLAGPPPLPPHDLQLRRYIITDLIDDIRTPRSPHELTATGTQLYAALPDFYFRSQNLWSAKGKTMLRKLHQHNPDFAQRFIIAFDTLFSTANPHPVIALAEEVLTPSGGFLFDGHRLDAPADFRLSNSDLPAHQKRVVLIPPPSAPAIPHFPG
ncbi:nucleotidyltransferase domain-containing protein [bacterium]|nr:MAG: nucleotidyltransferase domain-containing protein [bacterium]